ncbi:DUF3489 domain-containing protein [Rhodovarius lipocyclicus]|uniref:DUF3489 domain-containing protein n=1 Tax=Rhodovarius lipocyclicus TaxID=268410 RepID=UPI00135A241C|nr:DUF3489 domain-containing protein [Rhodovarius lipocyclicus]
MAHPKALTPAQQLILLTAAQRPDHAVLPFPDSIPRRGAVPQRLIASMLAQGLLEECLATEGADSWRQDDADQPLTLQLSNAGLAAAGRSAPSLHQSPAAPSAEPSPQDGDAADVATRPRSAPTGKLGLIMTAVAAESGATLEELIALTGWQPHTTRAALTRLRQRGFPLRLNLQGSRKAYVLMAHGDAAGAEANSTAMIEKVVVSNGIVEAGAGDSA